MKIPTDKKILEKIYKDYKEEYLTYEEDNSIRDSKVFVPIDIKKISRELKTEGDIVFGRLYYHLEQAYGYERPDGSKVSLFALGAGQDRHCIHFPFMVSILASIRSDRKKFFIPIMVSILSVLVAIIALIL